MGLNHMKKKSWIMKEQDPKTHVAGRKGFLEGLDMTESSTCGRKWRERERRGGVGGIFAFW